jgi:hypothetical protein
MDDPEIYESALKTEIEKLPSEVFVPHTWYSPARGYEEKSTQSSYTTLSVDHSLSLLLFEKTQYALKLYMESIPNGGLFSIYKSHPGKINKYGPGQSMDLHVDHIRDLTGEGGGVPILTLLFQPQGDYEGGDLIVRENIFSSGSDKVIIFPSNMLFPHEVRPVTTGERVSATIWAW